MGWNGRLIGNHSKFQVIFTYLSVKVNIREFLRLSGMAPSQGVEVITDLNNTRTVEPIAQGQRAKDLTQLGQQTEKYYICIFLGGPKSNQYSLQTSFDLRVEISECSRSMFVQNRRINVGIEVVHIAALGRLVDQTILQHVLSAQEDGQPFVVTDLLVLGNVDLASLLEEGAVIVVGIQGSQVIRNPVVFTEQNGLKNGQTWVLVDTDITGSVAHFAGIHGIAVTGYIPGKWQPLGSISLLHNHPTTLELTNVAVLLNGVSIDQREIQVGGDHGQLFSWTTAVLAVGVTIRQCSHKVETLSSHLGVGRIMGWHNDGEARLVGSVQANQATVIRATPSGMFFWWVKVLTIINQLNFD